MVSTSGKRRKWKYRGDGRHTEGIIEHKIGWGKKGLRCRQTEGKLWLVRKGEYSVEKKLK